MKNSLNLVLVILFFIVLGCSCPKMDELTKKSSSTPSNSSTSDTTTNDSTSDSKSELTLAKYNKIKEGMSLKEVVDIFGSEGVEQMSSGSGKYKVTSYKWEGDNYAFVTVIFTNDKETSKVQYGLK